MIKGSALPPVKDVAPPTLQELDELVAKWNATVDKYYVGLLEALPVGTPGTHRFEYDSVKMEYVHRSSGRRIKFKEVKRVLMMFTEKV